MVLERSGSEIEYRVESRGKARGESREDADSVLAYVSNPAAGRGRGILVIHEEWGLTDHTRDVCDRLARAGFVALAPDLLRGRTATNPAQAQQLGESLDLDRVTADLRRAAVELFSQPCSEGPRLGVVGTGMGGSLALLTASCNPRIGAVVDFYGSHPEVAPDLNALEASVLAIFAERDPKTPDTDVKALEAELQQAGVRMSIQVRAGVRRGYLNDSRPDVYDATAAAEAWVAMLAFLNAELA